MRMKYASSAAALAAVLLLAACGSGTESSSSANGSGADTPATSGPLQPVTGCGENAAFALANDVENGPARCDAGAPAPQPLPEKLEITVAASTKTSEFMAPIAMGIYKGEFAKENLDVKLQILPPADSLPLLAQGGIDVLASTSSAAFFNALGQGFEIRNVMGQGWNRPENQSGVWLRDDMELKDMAGVRMGSAVGLGSAANLPLRNALREVGVKLTDLNWTTVAVPDAVTALKNGALDATTILDPFWLDVAKDPNFHLVAPVVAPGGDNGGIYYGKRLLADRAIGVAFARAYIRTINTYLTGDYKKDPQILADEAAAMGTDVDAIQDIPSWVPNWDVVPEVSTQLQEMFMEAGVLQYQDIIPSDEVVDRSFTSEAVGMERK
jgi:NitT/TauT family transport system substrate-binding protein